MRRMTEAGKYTPSEKIGPRFAETLGHLRPGQKVRAIVLLCSHNPAGRLGRRGAPRHRQAMIDAVRQASGPALQEIDKILERYKGTRLATHADVLGSIPVETTPAGVSALASSEHVKAILEDQPISLLSLPR